MGQMKYLLEKDLAKSKKNYTYLFSRNVFALETFFPMAEAFQEKYEPDGST